MTYNITDDDIDKDNTKDDTDDYRSNGSSTDNDTDNCDGATENRVLTILPTDYKTFS